MKKITAALLIVLIFSSAAMCADAPEKKFKVIVEGIEDAKANSAAVRIISPRDQEIARLKALTQGTSMEKEIIDALIVKVINLEEELGKIRQTQTLLLGLFTALLVMVVALIFISWKKPRE